MKKIEGLSLKQRVLHALEREAQRLPFGVGSQIRARRSERLSHQLQQDLLDFDARQAGIALDQIRATDHPTTDDALRVAMQLGALSQRSQATRE